MSLRHRLLATSLVTLASGLGAVLVLGNVLLQQRVTSEAHSLLRARVQAQIAALIVGPDGVRIRDTPNDAVLDRQAWVIGDGRVLERPEGVSGALDRVAVALGRRGGVAERAGPAHTLLRVEPLAASGATRPVGAVVAALSDRPLERLRREVLLGSIVIGGMVVIAGGLAIARALSGALGPVTQMTRAAHRWGAGDLNQRFDLGAPRDELTELAATLDGLLDRIAASRRHEQRFASEVAHELRSPLAALRARAELALAADGDGAHRERVAALAVVIERVDTLAGAVDTLIAVARGELASSGQTVDVGALAQEFDQVRVTIAADVPRAEGEADVVRRALAPLVDNAQRHALSGVGIHVSADTRHVYARVCDDGPGLAPGLEEKAFALGWRAERPDGGGDGAGLGLPLARRLARSCGGDVTAAPGPGGDFTLVLPAAWDV